MKNKILSVFLTVLIFVLPLCGCGAVPEKEQGFSVVCSIFVPYDFARQIAGDRAKIKMLLPPGVESHSYEPSPSDIIEIENADLFFYVSEHTETWVSQIVDALEKNKVKTVDIAENLGIDVHDHHHGHEHEDEEHEEHEEHEVDEHIWTNLETAAKMAELIARELSQADGDNAEYYNANAKAYISQILALRDDFDRLVKTSKRREIVSGSRFAMKNFTNEFEIDFTAAFDSCVDNTEPSAAVMTNIIDKIKADNIPVIFYEELTEPKIARAVTKETGAKMLLLHSCHNISVSELKAGESYVSLMRQNYNNLKEALN